ncbi:MAG: Osmolarity sensor protein EnvZ [Pseudomonadota bacterium]
MRIRLFWRTFLLIGGLVALSLAATLRLTREFEHAPPERQIAWEIASIVNLTRSALVSSEGPRRSLLLDELARVEDVGVAPLEPGDRVEPLPSPSDTARLERSLRAMLGATTRVAGSVNDEPGLWVSFDIDGDEYWLVMNIERWTRRFGPPWWLVATLAIGVSMLGAIAISRLVNRPLASLARAIGGVSRGEKPPTLPEHGPTEIATLNQRFNRMAVDLATLEADRTLALAGISHDIRAPLTRLRLEIELAPLAESDRESMCADVDRIDEIVGKFVEYARSAPNAEGHRPSATTEIDAEATIRRIVDGYRVRAQAGASGITASIAPGLRWIGDPLDLERILANLLENATRYGRSPDSGELSIEVTALRDDSGLRLQVRDRGPGVPESELERLVRPFARLDRERSEAGGSGLGLAIVERIARRHGGYCRLRNRPDGGLEVEVRV